MTLYRPLVIETLETAGLAPSMWAMRLPHLGQADTCVDGLGPRDADLARRLILAGDDHAKALRGIIVWARLEMQVGWMIEFETYRHGVECLSTSSAMLTDLRTMRGAELAEAKQAALPERVYIRIATMSYQALRRMYFARRHHRHPDWRIFCEWVTTLPYADKLITIEKQEKINVLE